tara:strand:+ start:197 stop:466 length:270 start_codon:yes stop_codon:yes gene_type:complete
MKFLRKIAFLISSLVILSGCDAQTLSEISNALNQSYGYGSTSNSYNSGTVGFKTGERISGFNKICFYNKLGSTYTINIPSTSLCPLTIN